MNVSKDLIFKAKDAPKQILYCVVMEPETVDLQEDTTSADEIEKAAHQYMLDSRIVGDSHRKNERATIIEADAGVVESFIAPVDFEVGTERILKGSWVMAVKVNSTSLWKSIEDGEITGLSIGGVGERVSDDG